MIGPVTEGRRYGVEAWLREGLLLEKYRYAPGPAEELPTHSHEEYQICLSLDFPGFSGPAGRSAMARRGYGRVVNVASRRLLRGGGARRREGQRDVPRVGPHRHGRLWRPRSTEEAVDTLVWPATLLPDGPNGGIFRDRSPIPW